MSDLLTLFSPKTLEEHFSSEWLPGFISVNDFTEELIELLDELNKSRKLGIKKKKHKQVKIIKSVSVEEKICSKCHRFYPATEEYFYLRKKGRKHNIFEYICKECKNKFVNERLVIRKKMKKDFKELIKKYYKRIENEGSVSQAHKAIESLTLIKVIEDIEKIIGTVEPNEIHNRFSGQERGE